MPETIAALGISENLVLDLVVHHPIEVEDDETDPRWILCKRPCIVVGGE